MDIVCISHLWWDWVWQRPQQLMSRLARDCRVFWSEEPHIEIGPHFEGFTVTERLPNLQVGSLIYRSDKELFWQRLEETLQRSGAAGFRLRENLAEASLLFGSPVHSRLEREVTSYVSTWRQGPLVLWLYSPMVVDFIDLIQPDLVVYDVMDELRSFKYAPPKLIRQEAELMRRADLVFAGGPSLYEARKSRHPDVHDFPSGVDPDHFAQALGPLPVPPQLDGIAHPVIGYFGVIDERLDYELLDRMAELRPAWSFVMIGPVLKVEEQRLPRRSNIHYLGKQKYEDLPAFLRQFDVAISPFSLNTSTRFISPTKTLEYMDAHKPIVSTPIPDVISLYGDVVRIADGSEAFVAQVEAALSEPADDRSARWALEDEILARHSWDNITAEMLALIHDRLERKDELQLAHTGTQAL